MVDIPPEVWDQIARFVPEEELCHLLAVNKVFFNVAMDLRWTEVSIVTRKTSEAMHILQRLRDPFIAKRLRRFFIRLTHVKERHSAGSQENSRDFGRLRQQFHLTVNRVFKVFRRETETPQTREGDALGLAMSDPRRPRPTFSEVMDVIVDAAPLFVNVNDLRIDSWDLPPSYNLRGLFTSFWKSFGANLQCLSLGGNLEGYRVLIDSRPNLKQLRELRVEFTNNLFRVDQDADAIILVDIIAPFINSLNPHLTTLRIWSWASLDLSVFFERLTVLPILEYLNIRMAFNRTLENPSGLRRLLSECSDTLKKLDLRLNPSGLPLNPVWEEPLSHWLSTCIADEKCFANLRSLDIYPTNTPAGIDILLACIQRTSDTLESLIVRDRYLHHSEVKLVVEAASRCHNLTSLRMNVWKVDVTLLDLLASKIPWLEQIWLSAGESLSNTEHGDLAVAGQWSNLPQDLMKRRYEHWNLKDISIWHGGQEVDGETMTALARCIPSIDSFFGNGHMDLPP